MITNTEYVGDVKLLDAELISALGVLAEAPHPAHEAVADALGLPGWAEAAGSIFVVELLPYASIQLSNDGMLGGDPAARIGGFWRALGYDVPAEPDHLAALLGLYAALVRAEVGEEDQARARLWRHARSTLLWEHLLTWVGGYLAAVEAVGTPALIHWSRLLREVLTRQLSRSDPAPVTFTALEAISPFPEDADDLAALTRVLLAPGRTGMLLTRGDLARCGRELGTGVRIGERAFILRNLLTTAPVEVFDWLLGEAQTWQQRQLDSAVLVGPIAPFWAQRAADCRTQLGHYRAQVIAQGTPLP